MSKTQAPDPAREPVTLDQVAEAIESLDDCARMTIGVDASGPRELLYRFLEQCKRAAIPAPEGADRTPAGFNRPPNGEPCNTEDWNAGYEAGFADGKAAPAPQAAPVALTPSQVHDLCNECYLDWHRGWSIDEEPNRYLQLARAIERAHGIPAPKEPKA